MLVSVRAAAGAVSCASLGGPEALRSRSRGVLARGSHRAEETTHAAPKHREKGPP